MIKIMFEVSTIYCEADMQYNKKIHLNSVCSNKKKKKFQWNNILPTRRKIQWSTIWKSTAYPCQSSQCCVFWHTFLLTTVLKSGDLSYCSRPVCWMLIKSYIFQVSYLVVPWWMSPQSWRNRWGNTTTRLKRFSLPPGCTSSCLWAQWHQLGLRKRIITYVSTRTSQSYSSTVPASGGESTNTASIKSLTTNKRWG